MATNQIPVGPRGYTRADLSLDLYLDWAASDQEAEAYPYPYDLYESEELAA